MSRVCVRVVDAHAAVGCVAASCRRQLACLGKQKKASVCNDHLFSARTHKRARTARKHNRPRAATHPITLSPSSAGCPPRHLLLVVSGTRRYRQSPGSRCLQCWRLDCGQTRIQTPTLIQTLIQTLTLLRVPTLPQVRRAHCGVLR